tara:strand:- start:132 stop:746 length:615 start_codon:yes stop_codon:yes gene_type:complete
MVEKSINQIKSETFKALIGINLSKSLADDCSNLCCNLAKIKTPFLRDLITLLEKYKTKKINNSIDHKTSKDLIAPFYGLNLIEYLSSENINWSGNVIAPNYLISAMLIYNHENKKNFLLRNNKKITIFCIYNSTIYLNKKKLTNDFYYIETELYPSKIKKVKFNKILYYDRCYVNSIEWNKLLKYSQKTYVKESKVSKEKGAGY